MDISISFFHSNFLHHPFTDVFPMFSVANPPAVSSEGAKFGKYTFFYKTTTGVQYYLYWILDSDYYNKLSVSGHFLALLVFRSKTMKMKPQSTPYDPRASPSLNRSVRVGQDGAPPPPPPPPPHMHHHHHPRHRHDNHIIMAPVYHRQSYGQPRLGPPGRPYEHSRYYHDYHRHPSTYPPPPPSPSHAPQYGSSIPPLHYRESSPEARSSPPRDGQPASPSAIDLFRTGGCTCKKSK